MTHDGFLQRSRQKERREEAERVMKERLAEAPPGVNLPMGVSKNSGFPPKMDPYPS